MAKKRIAYALSVAALVAGSGLLVPASLFAEGEVKTLESCEGLEDCAIVTNTEELKAKVLIGESFELTADVRTGADMELYLNDYTITSDGWSIINVDGELTIYAGENGRIEETGGTYAPLYVYNNTVMKSGTIDAAGLTVSVYYDTGLFTMEGGTITGGSNTATTINVGNGAKMVMNDGQINGDTWGVSVFKDAEFEMNGGTIDIASNDGIGVSGNGSASGNNEGTNAKLTLNAGVINSGDLGVYAPQINGQTVLGDSLEINAGKCGVEIRAGELTVEGAEINVDPEATYEFNPNGSGSTASGVGIAVAQHTTKQEITVNVNDGVFTAPVAFAEGNPQHNPDEDIAKVNLAITGGDFLATNGDPIVASEDVEEFITGGHYNKVPDNGNYVANGYDVYPDGEMYVVDRSPAAYQGGDIFLQKGESIDIDLGEIGNMYATLALSGEQVASIEDRTITATADGTSNLVIDYNTQIHPMTTGVNLVVYSVGTDESDVIEGEDRDEVADFTAGQIKDLIDSGEETNNSLQLFPRFDEETGEPIEGTGLERLKDALIRGDEVFTSLDAWDLVEELWGGAPGMDTIDEHLGDDEEIAMVYEVNLGLFAGDYHDQLGEVTDLGDLEIEFDLEIPEAYREAPEGYTREFSVLRCHRGVWDRPEFTREGDVLKTRSSIFSTYVVAYTDTENGTDPVNPGGDDNSGTETDGTEEGTEAGSETGSPNTGTVTVAGASAMSAAIVTSVVMGLLASIVSFAYLIRRK